MQGIATMMVSRAPHLYMAGYMAVALLAGVPSTGLAAHRPAYEWLEDERGDFVSLYYGSRDDFPGNGPFNLLCNNAEKRVFFTFVHEEGTQLGKSPSVELSAGAAKASLTGIISPPDETGHTFFESRVVGVKPVLAVLQTSRTLTVKLGAKSTTLPDKGRAAAADQFAKACKVE
jgi:hypothetical protein